MFKRARGKLDEIVSKAVSGDVNMRSLVPLLQMIGMILAMILGVLAILVVIFLIQTGQAAP